MRELEKYVGESLICHNSSINSAERELPTSKIDKKKFSDQNTLSRELLSTHL